jgi:peptide subunit release factor 1 (eRF1)
MADKEYEFECPTCGSRFTIITSETDKPVHCPFCASALDDEEADDDYDWDEE